MNISSEIRQKIMSSIPRVGTKPELIVRRYLFACGYRFRINLSSLPGSPDIVLRKYKVCIFINGCFWHWHDCKGFRMPKTNIEYWKNKLNRNKERDIEKRKALRALGWHTITIWECELKKDKLKQTLESLDYTLNHLFIKDRSIKYDTNYNKKHFLVAENPTQYPNKLD